MKKIRNSRKGFTLVEIVLVIAVVVILSSASVVGIAATIQKAENAQDKVNSHEEFEDAAWYEVNHITFWEDNMGMAPVHTPDPEAVKNEQDKAVQDEIDSLLAQGYSEEDLIIEYDGDYKTSVRVRDGAKPKTQSGGGTANGGTANGGSTPVGDQPGNQPGQQPGQQPADQPGNQPGQQPADQPGQQSGSGSTGSGSSGAVTYNGSTVTRGTPGSGVMSVTQNSDGSTTVGLLYNQWCDGSVQVWNNGNGTYDIQGIKDGGNVIGNALASTGTSFDWNPINSNQRFTLSKDQKNALESVYGIKFT